MTFSYDESEDTDLDIVRGMIGDTSSARADLSNETITAILARFGSVTAAACECIRRIIALRMRDTDRSAIGMSTSRSQIITHLQDMLAIYQSQLATTAEMFVGGVSKAANELQEEDEDLVPSMFKVGMDDYPGTE